MALSILSPQFVFLSKEKKSIPLEFFLDQCWALGLIGCGPVLLCFYFDLIFCQWIKKIKIKNGSWLFSPKAHHCLLMPVMKIYTSISLLILSIHSKGHRLPRHLWLHELPAVSAALLQVILSYQLPCLMTIQSLWWCKKKAVHLWLS